MRDTGLTVISILVNFRENSDDRSLEWRQGLNCDRLGDVKVYSFNVDSDKVVDALSWISGDGRSFP
jgi:hypothetical protein